LQLFTDREQGPKARTESTIDRRVERAFAAMIRGFYSREAFGIDFPSKCQDGAGFAGTDVSAFEAALSGVVPEMEGWLDQAIHSNAGDKSFVKTENILDAIEWLAAHVGEPKKGAWHSYFNHHHLTWDRISGREAFKEAANDIFARNGLAYEMDEPGQIRRIVDGPTPDLLKRAQFSTGDKETDLLLERARRRFFDRDIDAGQHAIETLWDAFERIKTLEDPKNKKNSAKALIAKVSEIDSARALIEAEMMALTEIGNNWRIRHHEVGKTELANDAELRDYLFLRLFDLIRLLLSHRGGTTA